MNPRVFATRMIFSRDGNIESEENIPRICPEYIFCIVRAKTVKEKCLGPKLGALFSYRSLALDSRIIREVGFQSRVVSFEGGIGKLVVRGGGCLVEKRNRDPSGGKD